MTCNTDVRVFLKHNPDIQHEPQGLAAAFARRIGASLFVVISALFVSSFAHAQPRPWVEMSKGVYSGSYSNWTRSVFLYSAATERQAVIVPNFGGRIVHYSWRGRNLLLDVPEVGEEGNFHPGGHQADIGPETRQLPLHPILSLGKTSWQHKPYTVRILGDPDPAVGVALDKDILLDPDTGDLALTQRLRNIGKTNVSYSVWSRTALKPGGYALLPLDKKKDGVPSWTVHNLYKGSFVFDGTQYVSLNVREMDDVLVVYCDSEPTKLGAHSSAQWMAYVYDDLLFVKYTPYFPGGNYTEGGNTLELYFDRNVAELQALSPEVELAPKQNYAFPEKWMLIQLPKPVLTFKDARKLAKQIPEPPFAAPDRKRRK